MVVQLIILTIWEHISAETAIPDLIKQEFPWHGILTYNSESNDLRDEDSKEAIEKIKPEGR
jgi:hypothetical protein